MDDYYEFKHAHDIQIEEWWLYWSPNYVSIVRGIVAPSGATTFNISLTSESGGAIGIGAIGSGGTTRNGGTIKGGNARASISRHSPLPKFNPVVEFFHELQQNYQRVKIEKLRSL
jgi:hypothetical protein